MVLWFLGIPVCTAIPFILWTILSSTALDAGLVEDIVFVSTVLSLFAGIPTAILFASVAFERSRILKRTWKAGHIRRFAGTLSSEDWTNNTDAILRKAARVEIGSQVDMVADLHASDDVLYRIGDRETKQWIPLELTRGTRPPVAAARFKAPIEWLDPDREDEILRRRLTAGELDEILGYANRVRRARWWLALGLAWIVLSLSRLAGMEIFELGLPVIYAVCVGATIIGLVYIFYYSTSKAKLYERDWEDGWAIILEPPQVSTLTDGEMSMSEAIEVLPISGATWTIGGKPAGWRKRV
jgi:hypothetical protein